MQPCGARRAAAMGLDEEGLAGSGNISRKFFQPSAAQILHGNVRGGNVGLTPCARRTESLQASHARGGCPEKIGPASLRRGPDVPYASAGQDRRDYCTGAG